MHIEPGVVDGAKMAFAYVTAAGAASYSLKLAYDDIRQSNIASFLGRVGLGAVGTFVFFELLPHFAVGPSEVHFILGTTLFLLLGAAPAAFGLALGLLIQGLFFAPSDLPMYFVNVTTLLVPLLAISALGKSFIPQDRAYVDLRYSSVLKLSAMYQGGVVAWVAFWVVYGQGATAEALSGLAAFAGAYMLVLLIEPIADLAVLWAAKTFKGRGGDFGLLHHRVYNAA
ncbi:energy-coupling factor ABC transporter permease [Gymnodinialimonas sp. 2305UL16-5]|uniref:energy-coupling factor ABC transporter permease n=1 Tax=Gymnodinialimonas mytili TaxID=3126503 RepID=UPI00309C4638